MRCVAYLTELKQSDGEGRMSDCAEPFATSTTRFSRNHQVTTLGITKYSVCIRKVPAFEYSFNVLSKSLCYGSWKISLDNRPCLCFVARAFKLCPAGLNVLNPFI